MCLLLYWIFLYETFLSKKNNLQNPYASHSVRVLQIFLSLLILHILKFYFQFILLILSIKSSQSSIQFSVIQSQNIQFSSISSSFLQTFISLILISSFQYFVICASSIPLQKQGFDFLGTMPYKIAHWFENHEFVQTTMQVFHLFS